MLFSLDETFKKKKKIQALVLDIGFSMLNDIILLQEKKDREENGKKMTILVKDKIHVFLGGLLCSKSRS